MPLTYINKKDQVVPLTVSAHARIRFKDRWQHVFSDKVFPKDAEAELERWFASATRVENLNREEKVRLERYGKDTLYFRTANFQFVVQDATLRTVELHGEEMRVLNKVRSKHVVEPAPPAELPPKYRISVLVDNGDSLTSLNGGTFRSTEPVAKLLLDKTLFSNALTNTLTIRPQISRKQVKSVRLMLCKKRGETYLGDILSGFQRLQETVQVADGG